MWIFRFIEKPNSNSSCLLTHDCLSCVLSWPFSGLAVGDIVVRHVAQRHATLSDSKCLLSGASPSIRHSESGTCEHAPPVRSPASFCFRLSFRTRSPARAWRSGRMAGAPTQAHSPHGGYVQHFRWGSRSSGRPRRILDGPKNAPTLLPGLSCFFLFALRGGCFLPPKTQKEKASLWQRGSFLNSGPLLVTERKPKCWLPMAYVWVVPNIEMGLV